MRLGGPLYGDFPDPSEWIAAVRAAGYSAANWPLAVDADEQQVSAFVSAAREADIVIAEVGAWSNPLSPDEPTGREAIETCKTSLAVADRVAARCCVNIAGSRGPKWDGPCAEDLTDATFERIVETVREIIDAVQPSRTFYTLETMPWMPPDSADSYLDLIEAIDRPRFAVHFDPVNLINCPRRYFDTTAVLHECFDKLGGRIKSCHAKDILLRDRLTVHLDEVPPGEGSLDYVVFLRRLADLDPDTPLMLEHMKPEQYAPAAEHIRRVAAEAGVGIR